MRGFAILMVIGIHSLQQPLNSWETLADAVLRPCVPIFLFASGYLTVLSGRVPLVRRLKAVLIPYATAFAAAFKAMAATAKASISAAMTCDAPAFIAAIASNPDPAPKSSAARPCTNSG